MYRLQNAGRNPRKTNGLRLDDPLPDTARSHYIGRFAPSPTGPLHPGSLFTAVASYLDARHHGGQWLLRVDDLDTPRNRSGAADAILQTLIAFGLQWDGEVYYQSRHLETYQQYLAELECLGITYRCSCSRKVLADYFSAADATDENSRYPGICRNKTLAPDIPSAIRVKAGAAEIAFQDSLQGVVSQNLAQQQGDFILKRKDGIVAYQFAVVVDDCLQQINHVVRGCDLLAETPKQIYLQRLLGFATPTYLHVPVLIDRQGFKLSKQTLATAVDTTMVNATLFEILNLLKQNPPSDLKFAAGKDILGWGVTHWKPEALGLCSAISI